LLALLALSDRPLSRLYIAGILWIDASEKRASGSLRSALWRLKLPSLQLVESVGDHLQLARQVVVDVRQAIAQARRLLDRSAICEEADLDESPLCGDLLPGWYDDWVLIERERERQIRLHALETLCERLTAEGRFVRAISAGLAAVEAEPLRESAHRALIKAHLAEGNPGEAIRQYRTYARLLRDELKLDPSVHIKRIMEGLGIQ
jgi:DNA-binding SARP family transcriptional activator